MSTIHNDHLQLGKRGEELAAAYLQQLGYVLVAANFVVPVGRNRLGAVVNVEIDLVAYDGSTLCFIEVKTRSSKHFAAPSENVDLRKQRQITRAARTYRHIFGLAEQTFRYDVVSIVLPVHDEGPAKTEIEVLRGFWTEEKFRKRYWTERYWD
jgi:putative endonuclease